MALHVNHVQIFDRVGRAGRVFGQADFIDVAEMPPGHAIAVFVAEFDGTAPQAGVGVLADIDGKGRARIGQIQNRDGFRLVCGIEFRCQLRIVPDGKAVTFDTAIVVGFG